MNSFSKIVAGLRDHLTRRRQATPDIRLQVSNLTRHTVLATHMEVAGSGPKRNTGLLGRECLSPGGGLWILPCQAVHTFGMRFPIDLVYLDRKKQIKKLRSKVPPGRLSACLLAHSVLELPPGTIRATQTQPGDTLEFWSAPLASDRSEF
jgi:uncharacterized membrane protein (UPF0127 family)